MLKMLKVTIEFEVKGDRGDMDDLRDRVYDKVANMVEDGTLEFYADEPEDDEEDYE